MAAYSGTPTVNLAFEQGDRNGKLVRVVRNLTLSISSQGGTSNTIGAAALGFSTAAGSITAVNLVNFTDSSPQNRAISVWTNGVTIFLGDPQAATDAARSEPIDLTGTLQIEVYGWPA